jgi:hypothetical protein
MDNSTVKEAWIDKLIDEFVDAKDKASRLELDSSQLDTLVKIILNSSRLDYNGESLRIDNESAIFAYLMVIYPETYKRRLEELKAARDEERALIEAANAEARAEVAATEEA